MADLRLSARRMARVGLGSGLTTVWSALLGLITAPFLIRNLGAGQYGVFALISLISSYLTNLEFGFGHATIRFLSRARAADDPREMSAVLGSGLAVYIPGTLLAGAISFFGADFIVEHFARGPSALHHTFVDAIRLGALVIAVSMFGSFVSATLQALGRFGFLINTNWIFGTILSGGAVTIVVLGGGLVDVIALQLIVNSILVVLSGLILLRAIGRTARPRLERRTFRAMAAFSLWAMVAGIASQTMIQGPPAVLAAYKTTMEIAAFAVPSSIFQQLTGLVGSAGLAFLPFVSASSLDPDLSPVRAIYAANLRMTVLILAPLVSFIAVFAHPLLATWISTAFALGATDPLRFMVIAALVLGLGSPPSDLARGLGKPALVTGYTIVAAVVVVGLSFALVPRHGAAGAALALCVGLALVTLPFIFISGLWVAQLRPSALMRSLAGPLCALVCVLTLYEVGLLVSDTFASAIITGGVGTPIYLVLASKVFLDDRERQVFKGLLGRALPHKRRSS